MHEIHHPTDSGDTDTQPVRGTLRRFDSFADMKADEYRYWHSRPVHLFAAVGTHKDIAKRVGERFGGLSDAVNMRTGEVNTERSRVPVTTEGDIPPDVLQDIKKIPTPFKGYKTAW